MNVLSPKIFESLKPESYLSLTDSFHQFSLPMSYGSDIKNLKKITGVNTRCYKLFRVLPFEHWKFLFCCLIFRYMFFLLATPFLGLTLGLLSKFTFLWLKVA